MKRGLSRRNLFKYMGLGGATVVAAGCEQKPEKLIPLLVPPDGYEYTPHRSYQYMTTCQECSAGCGMMVTAREGRAQKAEGNPNHPMNQGALCARGQGSMQTLYNPARLVTPQAKGGAVVSWEDAEKQLVDALKSADGKVAYWGAPTTGSGERFLNQWVNAIGGGKRYFFDMQAPSNARKANEIAFGRADDPLYEIDKAKYLINFSTDFMETWGNSIENTKRFTKMHAYSDQHKNKFVHVGPHISLTGAKADEWLQITPGAEGVVALSIAHVIRNEKTNMRFLKDYLEPYAPEKVAKQVGTTAEKIRKIAQEMMDNAPSIAIGGGLMTATEQGTETLVAINILNAVAGNVGRTVNFISQAVPTNVSHKDTEQLISSLNSGDVKVLIVDSINPLYALPKSAGLEKAIANTFVVSLSSEQNETTHLANLVLPILTGYESWGDSQPREGIRNISQPVMAPVNVFNAKAKEDILLSVNAALGTGQFADTPRYLDYLKKSWKRLQLEVGDTGAFDAFWIKVLETGGLFTDTPTVKVGLTNDVVNYKSEIPTFSGDGLTVLPSPSIMLGDGSGAKNPWLQEVPNPITQIVWDSWVEINPDTAHKLGIHDRDMVTVTTPHGTVEGTAVFHFGIHRDAIAMPLGQGHTQSGLAADNYGFNVMDLLPSKADKTSGEFAWVNVKAKVAHSPKKSYTVNLDGNARQLGRNIAAATTLNALKGGDDHHGSAHAPRPREVYPPRKETAGYYKPYRWGMTIDLDRCNGCSACVVACYSENNIPVVGKERAGVGREMSWIRMERYIEGYGDDFEVRISPMTCQHCENAGCETVCPVYATYHNPEGLNVMVYNRCVGTRYCSNNCAYKVRRFNWFDYDFPEPLNQQLNSTITTREVGVMEKCNFCVHRIKEAQSAARDLGRDVQDGEVITACQQTCPTEAITFGNLADANSKVSKLAKRDEKEMTHRDRQYEVMPELNYKPAITYLKKVNLRETKSHGSAAAAH